MITAFDVRIVRRNRWKRESVMINKVSPSHCFFLWFAWNFLYIYVYMFFPLHFVDYESINRGWHLWWHSEHFAWNANSVEKVLFYLSKSKFNWTFTHMHVPWVWLEKKNGSVGTLDSMWIEWEGYNYPMCKKSFHTH